MSGELQGKVCLLTGATGGMGRAIAATFLEAGALVVASDLRADDLAELTDLTELTGGLKDPAGGGGSALATMAADVSSAEDVAGLVAFAVDRYGRLDAAVNAAAIENETVPLHELADEAFDTITAVNLRSVFLCMKHEIGAMLAHGDGGAIVNIASTNSFKPQANQAAYTASKHGVLGLTRSAALDYGARGIRINAICPGAIDTPMLRGAMERRGRDPEETARRLSRLGRFGQPDEIARAALWLCSEASSFTTGHALAVDGGMLGTS